MSEWLKEHAWKACVGETLPWVRIPLSPPAFARLRRASARPARGWPRILRAPRQAKDVSTKRRSREVGPPRRLTASSSCGSRRNQDLRNRSSAGSDAGLELHVLRRHRMCAEGDLCGGQSVRDDEKHTTTVLGGPEPRLDLLAKAVSVARNPRSAHCGTNAGIDARHDVR